MKLLAKAGLGILALVPFVALVWLAIYARATEGAGATMDSSAAQQTFEQFEAISNTVSVIGFLTVAQIFYYWRLVARAEGSQREFRAGVLVALCLLNVAALPYVWFRYVWKPRVSV